MKKRSGDRPSPLVKIIGELITDREVEEMRGYFNFRGQKAKRRLIIFRTRSWGEFQVELRGMRKGVVKRGQVLKSYCRRRKSEKSARGTYFILEGVKPRDLVVMNDERGEIFIPAVGDVIGS